MTRSLINAINAAVGKLKSDLNAQIDSSSADINLLRNGSYRVKINLLIRPEPQVAEDQQKE